MDAFEMILNESFTLWELVCLYRLEMHLAENDDKPGGLMVFLDPQEYEAYLRENEHHSRHVDLYYDIDEYGNEL